jgi:hypothetical protein
MTAAVVVLLSSALLCVSGKCYPALVGADTPTGTFLFHRVSVTAPGYGGDVLEFKETDRYVFAIHRVWTLRPAEDRVRRLEKGTVAERRNITRGCINVTSEVYTRLPDFGEIAIQP